MEKLAVIKTGGKQYLVGLGTKLKIEKLPQKQGEKIVFDQVLLVKKGDEITIGQPGVKEASVEGRVLRQGKGEKLIIFKYKPKKRYKVKKGHRQPYTEIEITKIQTNKL